MIGKVKIVITDPTTLVMNEIRAGRRRTRDIVKALRGRLSERDATKTLLALKREGVIDDSISGRSLTAFRSSHWRIIGDPTLPASPAAGVIDPGSIPVPAGVSPLTRHEAAVYMALPDDGGRLDLAEIVNRAGIGANAARDALRALESVDMVDVEGGIRTRRTWRKIAIADLEK